MDEALEITSPEYPNYTDAAVCEWELQPPTTASFTLQFLNFRLPNTDSKGEYASEVQDLLFIHLCLMSVWKMAVSFIMAVE